MGVNDDQPPAEGTSTVAREELRAVGEVDKVSRRLLSRGGGRQLWGGRRAAEGERRRLVVVSSIENTEILKTNIFRFFKFLPSPPS